MSKARDLLLDIATEKNGYSIGKPWRFSEFSLAAVVPIIRLSEGVRGYKLASEVKKEVNIRDTGNINRMEFTNKSAFPVLLKSGEVVTGSTQSRTILTSQIIFPQEKLVVDCACVHATKGIRADQRVDLESYSPAEVRRVVKGRYAFQKQEYTNTLQNEIWNSVRSYTKGASEKVQHTAQVLFSAQLPMGDSRIGRMEKSSIMHSSIDPQTYYTPQEDLAGRVRELGNKLEEVLKKVPTEENQVGICLITLNGLESLESFNHPDAWKAIRESIIKSDSEKVADVTDSDSVFEYRADKARSVIRELLTTNYDERIAVEKDRTSTVTFVDKKLVGEVVILDDQPIHCSFVSKN